MLLIKYRKNLSKQLLFDHGQEEGVQMEQKVYDLVIEGNIVLPDRVLYNGSVAIKDGKIASVSKISHERRSHKVLKAHGKYVLPGAIDAHVHSYSALTEGFAAATRSAAAGGVTTIIEMPYDADQLICTKERYAAKKQKLSKEAVVDVAMLATIKPKNGLDQIPLLAEEGACGFKVSMFNTDSVRFPRIDDGELLEAFSLIAKTGCPVGVHAETDEIVRKYIEKYKQKGETDPRAHCWSRPKVAESTAVLTALELAYWTGVHLHIYHCTFPRIFELVQWFRQQGTKVTAETCTHYLILSEEDMPSLHARGKINPPLRTKEDVEQLWIQLSQGMIDLVTSDHAPWTIDRKNHADIFQNSSGAPGVETLLPLLYSEGVAKGRISMLTLVHLLSENPAKTFGLSHCKGRIEEGMDADLVVLDPNQSWVLNESELHSHAGWSPYHGFTVQGKIINTFVRGKLVYDGTVIGNPGDGKFIHAEHDAVKKSLQSDTVRCSVQ